jgi:hypothetical protein
MRSAIIAGSLLVLAWASCEGSRPHAVSGGHAGTGGSGPAGGSFPSGSSGQVGTAGFGDTGAAGQLGAPGSGVAGSFVPCPTTPPATDLFLAPQSIADAGDRWLGPVALGDLDGDGLADLVVGSHMMVPPGTGGNSGAGGSSGSDTGSIDVALADPAKVFAPQVRYDGYDPYWFATADVTGDKHLDLVMAGPWGAMMLPNTGEGTLGARTQYIPTTPGLVSALAVADLDGDGKAEVVLGTRYSNGQGVVVLAWDGAAFQPVQNVDSGVNVWTLAVGDVDGHAGPDLLVVNEAGGLHVLLNDGSGHLGAPMVIEGVFPSSITLADVDADGKPDIVSKVSNFKDGYAVMSNQGDGHFAAPRSLPLGDGSGEAAFSDIDGDGKVDAVVSSDACKTLLLYPNDGKGSFSPPKTIEAANSQFALGDVNGDKAPALVLLARGGVVAQLHSAP